MNFQEHIPVASVEACTSIQIKMSVLYFSVKSSQAVQAQVICYLLQKAFNPENGPLDSFRH